MSTKEHMHDSGFPRFHPCAPARLFFGYACAGRVETRPPSHASSLVIAAPDLKFYAFFETQGKTASRPSRQSLVKKKGREDNTKRIAILQNRLYNAGRLPAPPISAGDEKVV